MLGTSAGIFAFPWELLASVRSVRPFYCQPCRSRELWTLFQLIGLNSGARSSQDDIQTGKPLHLSDQIIFMQNQVENRSEMQRREAIIVIVSRFLCNVCVQGLVPPSKDVIKIEKSLDSYHQKNY